MQRYVGLDAHATSCSFGVLNERGKNTGQAVIETNGAALVEHVKTIPGRKSLCLEEGAQSSWLYEILSPHVDELVVTRVVQKSQGSKDDIRDAFRLAEMLRLGNVLPVFKEKGQFSRLRAQSDLYGKVNADSVRAQCRLKALFRSRGVSTTDGDVYASAQREQWLNRLPVAYRSAAEVMYEQYDAACRAKLQAAEQLKKASHAHPISRILETAPGMGAILLALTGVSAIILGMGITTTAVYITVAALIVPALVKSGIVPIAAHMFAFYFGVVSAITPPVALASFAAAAIAKSPPMATAVESTRIGIAKYIVPLVFVYDPSLLFVGPLWATVISTALAMTGLWVLTIGLEGWYRGPVNPLQRLAVLVAAILILLPPLDRIGGLPGYVADTAGVALAAIVLVPRIMKALAGQVERQIA